MSNKLTIKSVLSITIVFASIPILMLLSSQMDNRKYYLISFVMILLAIAAFFFAFEKRKPQAREIIVIAVLSTIAVVGRTAFIMLPFFKPLAAIVIISGVALGSQAGFLCGAVSCLASNFVFGQGPWTPWQMVAYGLAGFWAGLIFYKKEKRQKSIYIAIYGVLVVMLLVGPLLDISGLFINTQMPDAVVTMWTLENFIEKSQSMNNRGYKLKGKTTFSIYRFDNRDRNIIIWIFFLITIIGVGHALEQNNILYKPQIIMFRITPVSCFFYFAYAAFCLLPFVLQVLNETRFNFERDKKL